MQDIYYYLTNSFMFQLYEQKEREYLQSLERKEESS